MTPPTTELPTPRVPPSQLHALTPKRPSPDCLHVWHLGFSQWDGAPCGRYAVWLGRLRDRRRGHVGEGCACDDVDPPDESGGRVPVPDVLGGAGRRVGACGVGVDPVLRAVRDSAGAVPWPGARWS